MQHTKKVPVPATSRTEVTQVTCDLCGQPLRTTSSGGDVTVSYEKGVHYPEGGSGTRVEFDLCAECFEGKLMTWFRENGATGPRETEWDY